MRFVLLVSCWWVAACGFSRVGNGGDAGRPEGPEGDVGDLSAAGPGDLGVSSAISDGGSCSGCGCGAPVLLVAVQSVNGATGHDGRVLQLALGPSGAATACGPELTASGSLSKTPTAISWVPPDGVLWGSQESVLYLDGARDLVRWAYRPTQSGNIPLALFRLQRPGAADAVAIGYDAQGYQSVSILALVALESGNQLNWLDVTVSSSPIYLGNTDVQAMAADPFDPTRIAYVFNGVMPHPVMQVAVPWDGAAVQPKVWYATRPPGVQPTALNTLVTAGVKRAVWLQGTNNDTVDDVVYEIDDDGTGPQLFGPLKCAASACAQPFKASDVVPDPTATHQVLATCASPTHNVRNVVRFDDRRCEVVVDGSKLPTLTFPFALAVGNAL